MRAAVFDLGGVLVEINHTWREAARQAGVACAAPGGLLECQALLDYQAGRIDEPEYYVRLAQYLGSSRNEAEAVHEAILVGPYPGTYEIVDALDSAGVHTGVLSNTNAPHWHAMTRTGRFPNVERARTRLASHEARLEKPDPRIYRAWEALAGVPPEAVLFFDDAPANVQAAHACGWDAVLVSPDVPPAGQIEAALAERRLL